METIEFIKLETDRVIMESLSVLLEDVVSRSNNDGCDPRTRLIAVDAERLRMQIRQLLSIPIGELIKKEPVPSVPTLPQVNLPKSRIANGVANGTIKQSKPNDNPEVQFGLGKIEVTENDEVIEEETPSNVKPFKPRSTQTTD